MPNQKKPGCDVSSHPRDVHHPSPVSARGYCGHLTRGGLPRTGGARLRWLAALALGMASVPVSSPASAQDDASIQACATAYEQAQVTRNNGQLVEAQSHLMVCVQDSCPTFVKSDCGRWLTELKREIPSVIFSAQDYRGEDVTDAQLTIDGVPVAEGLSGIPIELNPGRHTVVLVLGDQSHERALVVRQSEKNRVFTVELPAPDVDQDGIPDPQDACPTEAGVRAYRGCAAAPVAAPSVVAVPQPAADGGRLRTGAYIAWGLGAAGFATFAVFGLIGRSRTESGIDECKADLDACQTNGDAARLFNEVDRSNMIANIGVGVGAAGALLGGVMFYLGYRADHDSAVTVDVQPSTAGGTLSLRGRF